MDKDTEWAIEQFIDQITDGMSDTDYLEVLEEIESRCRCRRDAKKEEMADE